VAQLYPRALGSLLFIVRTVRGTQRQFVPHREHVNPRALGSLLFIVRTVRSTQRQFVPHREHVTSPLQRRLMLFSKTVTVYCENHAEHTNSVRTSQETLRLRYKAQHVNAAYGNSRCLLREPCGTHKSSPYLTGNTLRLRYKDQPLNANTETTSDYIDKRLTNDRPDLSSERAPPNDRTVT
jgi:hypothetical protein